MRRIIIILAAIFLTAATGEIIAQSGKNSDYYLQKAYEAIRDEEDYDKALEYVNEQLSDTPDDVSALLLRVRICLQQENYRTALTGVNRALKVNRPKKTGVANSSIHWWKAYVYQDMYDYEKAVDAAIGYYETAGNPIGILVSEVSLKHLNYAVAHKAC